MMAFAAVSAEIVATIAVFALTNLAILTFRDPQRTGWRRSSAAQLWIEMLTISAVLVIVPVLGAGVLSSFSNLLLGGSVYFGLVVALYLGVSHLMHMDERLARCDQGLSPFGRRKPPVAGEAA